MRFDYTSHDGTASVRAVEPHRLVHTGRRWYLVAWDVDRGQWRTFRVDRLTPRTPSGPRFTPRTPPDDIAGFTSTAVAVAAYKYRGVFTMHAPAEAVADVVSPTSCVVEPISGTRCRLTTGSNSLDALAIYVTVFGFDYDVHGPPELVDHVRVLAGRLQRAASGRAAGVTGDGSSPAPPR